MDYAHMTIRTVIVYISIAIFFRIMGKREIGELSLLDLVVFILLTEIAAIGIENHKIPLHEVTYPMIVIVLIQILFSFISLKSVRFRKILDGKPVFLIHNGKVLDKEMKKQRYTFDDLLLQLHENNIGDVRDVQYAILETNGKLSIFQKPSQNQNEQSDLTFPLILDGIIQHENLKQYQKDKEWLLAELKKHGYNDSKHIAYCSLRKGKIFIDEKDR